jgi:alanyl-tRNA synthetase
MLGIQVFNYPDKYVFFKEECVEFNYNWLTKELGIDPDEITFIEDVWAGGGNLGPSIEYFVGGLELGNMVFMQYKTFHDGTREELPIKVIDTGIGLERIPWLINGTPTSYVDVFKHAREVMINKLNLNVDNDIWYKVGPYTCLLNVDENDDIEATWEKIANLINEDVKTVKTAIAPIKDMYLILDHTRTLLLIISDGALPSNVGGGGNIRNILRRVFVVLK